MPGFRATTRAPEDKTDLCPFLLRHEIAARLENNLPAALIVGLCMEREERLGGSPTVGIYVGRIFIAGSQSST